MTFLEFCGSIFIIILLCITCGFLVHIIVDLIDRFKTYRYHKLRFKKKPIATCYCLYCIKYDVDNERCYDHRSNLEKRFGPNYFCSSAVRVDTDKDMMNRQERLKDKEEGKL